MATKRYTYLIKICLQNLKPETTWMTPHTFPFDWLYFKTYKIICYLYEKCCPCQRHSQLGSDIHIKISLTSNRLYTIISPIGKYSTESLEYVLMLYSISRFILTAVFAGWGLCNWTKRSIVSLGPIINTYIQLRPEITLAILVNFYIGPGYWMQTVALVMVIMKSSYNTNTMYKCLAIVTNHVLSYFDGMCSTGRSLF